MSGGHGNLGCDSQISQFFFCFETEPTCFTIGEFNIRVNPSIKV